MSTPSPAHFETRLRTLAARSPFRFPAASIPPHFRRAAVLLLFWTDPSDDVRVLLTRRSQGVPTHKGQISFPGGRLHEDESFEAAALRETEEEVGVAPSEIEVLGRLDDAWSGAGHFLIPYVGWAAQAPSFRADEREVAEILAPDLRTLLLPESRASHIVEHDGVQYTNAELRWPGGSIIGLSADLLLEALEWGTGEAPRRGEQRLRELHSYVWKDSGPGALAG